MREESKCKMVFDREKMLTHANEVLMSGLKGTELAKIMNMNVNQFYDYRNGSKKIEKPDLKRLLNSKSICIYARQTEKNY